MSRMSPRFTRLPEMVAMFPACREHNVPPSRDDELSFLTPENV